MRFATVAITLCTLLLSLPPTQAQGFPQVVAIDSGRVQGIYTHAPSGKRVIEYRGIPYAEAPVGERRWALPKTKQAWSGVLDASAFGSACPQVSRFALTDSSVTEDCLSLNVTLPADIKADEQLPVLFWIHGGGFVGGASNLYRTDWLATEGRLVVVTANYRLGYLGFVPLPALASDPVNGNFGIEDQREALRWVQRNIARFGGDPKRVTVAGESAGAASLCMHLASPEQVRGLFQQAIVVSAGCLAALKTVTQASEANGKAIADILGCPDGKDLNCLRAKSVSDILRAQTSFTAKNPIDLAAFAPAYGTPEAPNATISTSFADALAQRNGGSFLPVPILMGGMQKELLLYVGYWWQDALGGKGSALDNASIQRYWLPNFYGQHARAVAKKYGFDKPSAGAERLGVALSDYNPLLGINNCLYYRTADAIKAYPGASSNMYLFEFGDPQALVKGVGIERPYPDFPLGPVHSSILNYLFPHFSNDKKIDSPNLPASSQELAKQITQYWAAFIHTGHPTVHTLPAWAPYADSRSIMRFLPNQVGMFDGGASHHCDWWKTLYPKP